MSADVVRPAGTEESGLAAVARSDRPRATRSGRSAGWSRSTAAYALLAPGLSLLAVFTLAPIGFGLWLSFTDWDGVGTAQWVGLHNYAAIAHDPEFRTAMLNTIVFAIGAIVGKNVVGLALALLVNQKVRGQRLFRTVLFFPVTMSVIVIGAFWSFFLNGQDGLLNRALRGIGADWLARDWLTDPSVALYAVIAVEIWRYAGLHMLILHAGLQEVPEELNEAAKIDGAGAWRRFLVVTLPAIRPVLFVSVLLSLMGAFVRSFDLIWVLTRGSADTQVAVTEIYNEAFQFQKFGSSAAMGYVLFVVVAVIATIYIRQARGGRE